LFVIGRNGVDDAVSPHADALIEHDADGDALAEPDTHGKPHTHAEPDADGEPHAHAQPDALADTDTNANTNTNTNTDADVGRRCGRARSDEPVVPCRRCVVCDRRDRIGDRL
jgi:hypothetical protein